MLKGTLDDFTLPDIFRLLSLAKRTGTLAVARSAGSGRVFFRDGDVYFAESSLTREPLGQKLVRARAVTDGQLMKALDEHAAGGPRVGEILVSSGVLAPDQLEAAVREQIEDSVFDLLRWELGEFEWSPGGEVDVEVPIAVSVENLVMEASRRLDELAVIQRKIPSVDAVLQMAPKPPEGAVEINITPEEWRILVLVDGSRSVAGIAEAVSLDEFGAMRVLYGLVAAGLIELTPGHATPLDDEPAAWEAPAVEGLPEAPAPFRPLAVDLSPVSNGHGSSAPPPEAPAAVEAEPELDDPEPELDDSEPDFDPGERTAFVAAVDESSVPDFGDVAVPDLADLAEPLLEDEPVSIESFDAPRDEELVTEAPAPDSVVESAPAEIADHPEPSIDRAAVVRELAGLFSDEDRPRAQRAAGPREPQRLEDDDQITKGLISRLIDGVKGL